MGEIVTSGEEFAERSRRAALDAAIADRPLDDAVLAALVFERRYPRASGLGPLPLAELFPDADAHRLLAAEAAGLALLHAARGFADRLLAREDTAPALVEAMAVEHPGFTEKTYGDVLFFGVQTR